MGENSEQQANELAEPYRSWHSPRPPEAAGREIRNLIERLDPEAGDKG
jgi:hypothetical protein